MEQTLFAILTNKQVRDARTIEKSLDQEFMAGAPWFEKLRTEVLNQK